MRMHWRRSHALVAVRIISASELICGISLFVPRYWIWAALVSCALFVLFIVVIVLWTLQGEAGDCECGGLLPVQSIGIVHIFALSLLALMSGAATSVGAFAGARAATSQLVPIMQIVIPLFTLLLLLFATVLRTLTLATRARVETDLAFGRSS